MINGQNLHSRFELGTHKERVLGDASNDKAAGVGGARLDGDSDLGADGLFDHGFLNERDWHDAAVCIG